MIRYPLVVNSLSGNFYKNLYTSLESILRAFPADFKTQILQIYFGDNLLESYFYNKIVGQQLTDNE